MADGVIEIIISGKGDGSDGGGGDKSTPGKKPDKVMNFVRNIQHPVKTAESVLKKEDIKGFGKLAIGGKLLSDALSLGVQIAKTDLNRSFQLRENYFGQNMMNRFETQVSAAKNIASTTTGSVVSYAMLGSTFGPIGTAVGATLGLVVGGIKSAANIQLEKATKMEQYNMQLNATNAQTTFSASRANLVNGGRGTEY